jgi:exodeoxyribonuclease-3
MEHLYNRLEYLIRKRQEVVLCGDLNIVHQNIDVSSGQVNSTTTGCLPEERAWLNRLFNELGLVDVYRQLHLGIPGGYTWFNPCVPKQGWRIDYQIATPTMAEKAVRAEVFTQAQFSDHAPLVIDYED